MVHSPQDIPDPAPDPDLVAAVVLHTLVAEGRDGISVHDVARACERDPDDQTEREEIEAALNGLLGDGLAEREDSLFSPTRAATRASELSF